ncbi:MAG TPA: ArdC-like ssDNA-binding domain-containing protein [Pirellulales bacterium]|nr:ArdC-like ssDNA-binding domain-containing protein [Pirellulales bacterium]
MSNVYAIVTDRIVKQLEQGVVPWRKPWGGGDRAPRNACTRREYRGVNVFLLSAAGYDSPYWLTYRQADMWGGHVKKGEHGFPVVFWSIKDGIDEETGEARKLFILRYYTAFNVEQCEGLPSALLETPGPQRSISNRSSVVRQSWRVYRPIGRPSGTVGRKRSTGLLTIQFANCPDSRAFLFEGGPGVGKTSTALALAADIGATDTMSGLRVIPASELSIDVARELFDVALRMRPMMGSWQVVLIEELEHLSAQCTRFLKVSLDDTRRPPRCIVIATSNDASGIDKALRQRFDFYRFSAGRTFAADCAQRILEVWRQETGQEKLPAGASSWGWDGEEFSLRLAFNALERSARLAMSAAPQGVAA